MGLLGDVMGYLYLVVFAFLLMGGGIIVNMGQVLSLVVLPFSKDRFRWINNWYVRLKKRVISVVSYVSVCLFLSFCLCEP